MALFQYTAFGLAIASDFRFDVLDAWWEGDRPADLRVIRAAGLIRAAAPHDPYFDITPDRQYLHWRAVGAFLIEDPGTVRIEPHPGVSDHLVSQAFLGLVISLILERRGVLSLHAGAVAVDGRAAVFLGDKGGGKSTTCGALLSNGHVYITDDLVAVDDAVSDGALHVRPGFSTMKLWPDTLQALALCDDPRDRKVHPSLPKLQKRLERSVAHDPTPMGAVFVLRRDMQAHAVQVERLPPHEALQAVMRYTFMARYGETRLGRDHLGRHLRRCGAVVTQVPVHVLHVPADLGRLGEVARDVEATMQRLTVQPT